MKFDPPLISATLIKRYKRFLADVTYGDGKTDTVHCANPGSMMGLTNPGSRVYVSDSQNPKRKLRMSLEMIEENETWVGINTHLANKLAEAAILDGTISQLTGYGSLRREVKYGQNSRIDLLLEDDHQPPALIEVKSVTLRRKNSLAEFPDSVTKRGTKHLGELIDQVKAGKRAVQLFVVQRSDCDHFRPAQDIDPVYAQSLQQAEQSGVEILAYSAQVSPSGIEITKQIPVELT